MSEQPFPAGCVCMVVPVIPPIPAECILGTVTMGAHTTRVDEYGLCQEIADTNHHVIKTGMEIFEALEKATGGSDKFVFPVKCLKRIDEPPEEKTTEETDEHEVMA